MKNIILNLIIFLALTSCSSEIDLDKRNKTVLTFAELPTELQEIYSTTFPNFDESFEGHYTRSLDEGLEMSQYWTGMNKQLLTKGFNHHFVINDMEFKLGANKGDPFVLRNKKLYYTTELNLADYNFEKAKYIEIDLAQYLTK